MTHGGSGGTNIVPPPSAGGVLEDPDYPMYILAYGTYRRRIPIYYVYIRYR